jgi:hypothetical protein
MYLSSDEVAALGYLRQNTTADDVVLCSSLTGNFVPAYAPCKVYVGHWCETIQFGRALGAVTALLGAGQSVEERRRVIEQTGATLVYYGPLEKLLQQGLSRGGEIGSDPAAGLAELRPVYRNDSVTVYRVGAVAGSAGR